MKQTITETTKKKTFGQVREGELFVIEQIIYIKTKLTAGIFNSIALGSGVSYALGDHTPCDLVKEVQVFV